MDKFEIHIGEVFDSDGNTTKAKQTMVITREQFAVIEQFADTRRDENLNTIYKLNQCEFRVFPHLDSMDSE